MYRKPSFTGLVALVAVLVFLLPFYSHAGSGPGDNSLIRSSAKVRLSGRPPVIVIPGLTGSELINKDNGAKVWFNLGRDPDDDLRLPISANITENRDSLIAGDILRRIQIIRFIPEIEVYQTLIGSLEKGGYVEGKIDEPVESGDSDTFYVFPYDWRRDNVENARLLLEKMDRIRAQLGRPDLRFDIVAHSMGGLIARYAAMYGKSDVLSEKMKPDLRNAGYFSSISLIGTPNGGSMQSLNSLINGFSLFGTGKINIPFIRNMSKFDMFTLPSMYQLIPADGSLRAFDANLRAIKIDVFDPAAWEEYNWAAYSDREFSAEFNVAGQSSARAYFRAVLRRARLFREALNAGQGANSPVPIYYLGADCKPTLNGMILFRDRGTKRWETIFEADELIKKAGNRFTKAEIEKVLYSPGDGVVAKDSLVFASAKSSPVTIVCGEHNRLTGNEEIGRNIMKILNSSVDRTAAVKTGDPD